MRLQSTGRTSLLVIMSLFVAGQVSAVPPVWDSTVVYHTTTAIQLNDCDTVTLRFFIRQNQFYDSLARFDAGWLWNGGRVRMIDWREGPEWPDGVLGASGISRDAQSFHFAVREFLTTFDSTEAVLEMDFVASCLVKDAVVPIPFWFDTIGPGSNRNQFWRLPTHVYWPVHRWDGQILINQTPTSCGDVTEDGQVTSADIIALVDYVMKSGAPPSGAQGDVNCDGMETVTDIVLMVNFVFKGGL